MTLRRRIDERLKVLASAGERRQLRIIEDVSDSSVSREGRRVLNLCHNDYLGLAQNEEVTDAACRAVREWGAGSGASRLITGTSRLVTELEDTLAEFKGASSALVFPTGYQASVGVLSALVSREDTVFVDRLAHACLVDGVRLSGARLRVFPHGDIGRLEELLQRGGVSGARWIVVDGVYSMDGDLAPIPELLEVAHKHDAVLIVDDAHGTGVMGREGRGTLEHFGVEGREHEERLVVIATLSKALGAQGGAVLCSATLREWLVNRCRPFIYTTGLSPGAAGAALAALRILLRDADLVCELQRRAARVRSRFREVGMDIMQSGSAIVPVRAVDTASVVRMSDRLLEQGFLIMPIRPPTVPRDACRLRMTVSLAANEETILEAAEAVVGVWQGEES